MKEGYSVCFNEWALDKDIKNELGLLLIISSLTAEKGYCYASNKYFADLFEQPEQTISRKIKKLEEKQYITITYIKHGCEIISREIRLTKMLIDDKQKCESTINKNVKENNISINNISINNKKEIIKRKKFIPPTLEEIQNYIKEKSLKVEAQQFYDYFTETNWIDSRGNSVKNWKGKLLTWNGFKKDRTYKTFEERMKEAEEGFLNDIK